MLGTNLNDIVVFLAVVDAGSFVSGGKAAGLSRSAVAKAISRLELRLGTRLFNRTTRTLSLTHEGKTFHEHSLRIVDLIQDAEASVGGGRSVPKGVLRLTAPDAFGRKVMMPILSRFLNDWPDVQVEVSLADSVADIIEEGFDLAIRIGVTHADTSLVSRVITRYPTILCASPQYLAERGEPIRVEDLARHDCLYFTSGVQRQAWKLRDETGATVKAPGHSRLRLDSGEAIRDAAIAGLGIAHLPSFLVGDDLGAGALRCVLPQATTDLVDIVVLYPSKRLLEPRVRHFIDLMISSLSAQALADSLSGNASD